MVLSVRGADFRLEQIEVVICGNEGPLDLVLSSDSDGAPGVAIETLRLSVPPLCGPNAFADTPPLVAQSVLKPLLHGGTRYWLVASTQQLAFWVFSVARGPEALKNGSCSRSGDICFSDQECSFGETCQQNPDNPWGVGTISVEGACRVSGVAVPAPACGNASVEGNEECDDGNTVNGDGCDSNCRIECASVGRAKLTISKLLTPPLFDNTLTFSGTVTLPSPVNPPLDPLTNGMHLRIEQSARYHA